MSSFLCPLCPHLPPSLLLFTIVKTLPVETVEKLEGPRQTETRNGSANDLLKLVQIQIETETNKQINKKNCSCGRQ